MRTGLVVCLFYIEHIGITRSNRNIGGLVEFRKNELKIFLIMQLISKNDKEKVINIAGNASPLSWSRISFDVPAPLLSTLEGRK